MRSSTFARKPPGKRGVNKATMNEPQEEFINDSAKVVKSKQSVRREDTVPASRKSADQKTKK